MSLYKETKEYSMSRLTRTVFCNNLENAKKLLSEGADVHDNNDQALWTASMFGHLEIVKLLVAHGAKIYDEVIRIAKDNGHLEIEEYLTKRTMIKKLEEI